MNDTPKTARLIAAIEDREGEPVDCYTAPEEWVKLARELERELQDEKRIWAWINENPEAFTRIVVTKSWGRKVWWRAPNGNDYDTLRECVLSALPSNRLDHSKNELLAK